MLDITAYDVSIGCPWCVTPLYWGDMSGGGWLDLLCFVTNESEDEFVQAALDGLGMPLKCGFSPAIESILRSDLDEEPSRENTEVFDGLDLSHC